MWIMLCITEFVVHTVHYTIGSRNQVRATLEKPGAEIEETLPELTGSIHLVRRVSVQVKCVKEQ